MRLGTLQKFGGVSLILGSILLTLYSICFSLLLPVAEIRRDYVSAVLNPNWIWITAVAFFGVILMMFGFTAVYSKIHEDSGELGFFGYIIIEIAYLLQACKVTWEICLWPVIASNQAFVPLLKDAILLHSKFVSVLNYSAMGSIFLGIILFCAALTRSREFPKVAGILIFAGAMLYGFGPMLSVIASISGICVLSIGCLILGLGLILNSSDSSDLPS